MDRVPEIELRNALANRLKDWSLKGEGLQRVFEFPSFRMSMEFVQKVGEAAEQLGHHPDITINYNKVNIFTTSHDAGHLTFRDLDLAGKINELAPQYMHPDKLRSA